MDKSKESGIGAEDISPSFLSSSASDQLKRIESHGELNASPPKSPLIVTVFCYLSMEATSYFSCNLSLEMAKRNQTVSVIDFDVKQPNVRYLMGNLVNLQDAFPSENAYHLDFKIEHIKLYGFSKITIVSLAICGEQIISKKILERIFADQRIRESDIVLMNSPHGPDDLPLSDPLAHFERTLFLIDSQVSSLLKTYSWIKKLSPVCQRYLIGTISHQGEDAAQSRKHIDKLEKVTQKYLTVDCETLATDIPLDQDALNSIQLRRPLALMAPTSASGQAISHLCKNLLRVK